MLLVGPLGRRAMNSFSLVSRRLRARRQCLSYFTPLRLESLEPRTVLSFPPYLLTDLNAGLASSSPYSFQNLGSFTYFAATDAAHGTELWRTDGTAAGTTLVKDISPGPASSQPSVLTEAGGKLYFRADDGLHGVELWRTDGTATGTVMVKDLIAAAGAGSYPGHLVNANGTL